MAERHSVGCLEIRPRNCKQTSSLRSPFTVFGNFLLLIKTNMLVFKTNAPNYFKILGHAVFTVERQILQAQYRKEIKQA